MMHWRHLTLRSLNGRTTEKRHTGRSVGGLLANIDATNYRLSTNHGTVSGGGGFRPCDGVSGPMVRVRHRGGTGQANGVDQDVKDAPCSAARDRGLRDCRELRSDDPSGKRQPVVQR